MQTPWIFQSLSQSAGIHPQHPRTSQTMGGDPEIKIEIMLERKISIVRV